MTETFISETQEQTLARIETMLKEKLKIRVVSCDYFGKSLVKPKTTIEHCFAHESQPRGLTADITREMRDGSETFMNWRQDLGTWTSIYNLNSSHYGVLIALNPIDEYDDSERARAYKGFGTVGRLIIGSRSK